MSFYKGPPVPKFSEGPACQGCPFRATSIGWAPPTIPQGAEDENGINTEYLFLLEALGYEEVEQGRNAVGGTGKTFNRLLQNNTKISRSHQTVANTVCCRPIVWQECRECTINEKRNKSKEQVCTDKSEDKQSRIYNGVVGQKESSSTQTDNENSRRDGYTSQVQEQSLYKSKTSGNNDTLKEFDARSSKSGNECKRNLLEVPRNEILQIQNEKGSKYDSLQRLPQQISSCKKCQGKGQIPARQENQDYVNAPPSKAQVRECAARYTDLLIDRFNGKYIVALGKVPSEYLTGRTISITSMRGSIWEPGKLIACTECNAGKVESVKQLKCKTCKGKREVSEGRGKSRISRPCLDCNETGLYNKISLKDCKVCDGSGLKPENPDNEFVCEKLKPHQLLFLTFHPAALMHNPNYIPVVNRDFSQLEHLEENLKIESTVNYEAYPLPDSKAVAEMLKRASEKYPISIDIETTGSLNPHEGELYCIAATTEPTRGFSFDPGDPRVQEALNKPVIVGQNFVLYDWWWLHHKGFNIPEETKIYDTRYLGKLLNPDTPNDLVYLTGEFANPPIRGYWKTKEAYKGDKEGISCIDVDATLRVFHGQMEKISNNGQMKIVEEYILPMSKVVFDMRLRGMKINKEVMDETREIILRDLEDKRARLPWLRKDGSMGTENQSGEVQRYLYELSKLPVIDNRKTGKPTGNGEALEELQSRLEIGHRSIRYISDDDAQRIIEVIKNIGECRDLSKLEGNFLRYKLSQANFVHPALNMGGSSRGKHESGRGTASWRFSCSDPNAQQVPSKARNIFIPDEPDWEIASIDLRQAEIIGFLWYAEEWGILEKVLKYGMDAHQELANKILQRDASESERDAFKTTTFALLYGESPRSTSIRLHKPLEEVKQAREFYFKMLPGVVQYRQDTIEYASRNGYVESPFGFRRQIYIDNEYGRAANQACNAKIQNIPPIVTGRAMIGLHRELPKPARLWMQSHDEILLVYPQSERKEVIECAIDWLRRPVKELPAASLNMAGGLVFNIDIATGPNWRDVTNVTKEFGL